MLDCNNPFWAFSLSVYARPGVATECLALQNERNVDVNFLLFVAWLGHAYALTLSDETLTSIDANIAVWRDTAVRPLRTIRQRLKPLPTMSEPAAQELRAQIAQLELRAEQIEQAMLYALSRDLVDHNSPAQRTTPADAILHNVTALLARHRTSVTSMDATPPQAGHLIAEAIAYRPAAS
ncbi:MAG: TIGR02444 family protein [Rhodopseudomonas sp.]|nr:TIGR02444 family protein [Rhodopseudomonas sp.]